MSRLHLLWNGIPLAGLALALGMGLIRPPTAGAQDVLGLLNKGARALHAQNRYRESFDAYDKVVDALLKEPRSAARDKVIMEIRIEKHSVAYAVAREMIEKRLRRLHDVGVEDVLAALKHFTRPDGSIPSALTINAEAAGMDVVTLRTLNVELLRSLRNIPLPSRYEDLSGLLGEAKWRISGRITYYGDERKAREDYSMVVAKAGVVLKPGQAMCIELYRLSDDSGTFVSPYHLLLAWGGNAPDYEVMLKAGVIPKSDRGADGFGSGSMEIFRVRNTLLERKVIRIP